MTTIDLKKAIEVGCFTKWVNEGKLDGTPGRAPMIKQYLEGSNKGKMLVLAYSKKEADTLYHFFEDGNYIKIKNEQQVGKPISWAGGCDIAKIEGARKQETFKKTQDDYIGLLKSKIAGLLYPTTQEEKDDLDYQVQQRKLKKIDLSKGSPEDKIEARPDYFPSEGNYFIYLPAAKNESRDQIGRAHV